MSRQSTGRGSRPRRRSSPNEETQAEIEALKRNFDRLAQSAELADVHETINRIDEGLSSYPVELRELERRGYLHSRGLHEQLRALKGQWRQGKPRLERLLTEQRESLKSRVSSTRRLLVRARSGRSTAVSSAQDAIETLDDKLDDGKRLLRSHYDDVESELRSIGATLRRITKMLDHLDASPDIRLRNGEGPLLAVEAEWHRDGDEGPKGLLYLTDQRLLFEQKEEVVTKKRFGFLKADSEIVHKLWLDIDVADIASVKDKEEGGFLGIGKDDILEITGSGDASISRARFHLDGQDSADWRAQIRRIQAGEMAAERHEAAREEAATEASFPTQCPNCLATLPEAHPGASRVVCEFCGTAVGPG